MNNQLINYRLSDCQETATIGGGQYPTQHGNGYGQDYGGDYSLAYTSYDYRKSTQVSALQNNYAVVSQLSGSSGYAGSSAAFSQANQNGFYNINASPAILVDLF